MSDEWQGNIDGYEQTARSMLALGGELAGGDWARPTECPDWSVADQYAHVLGIERWMAGDTDDGVRRSAANTHLDVEASRGRPPAELLAELAGVIDRRVAALRSGAVDLAEPVETPFGVKMPYGNAMAFRAFDIWMHEQDVRRAVGRRGNLDGAAADVAARIANGVLCTIVGRRAEAAPGQSVVVRTPDRTWSVEVGADGQARLVPEAAAPTVLLTMEWETLLRLVGGRVGAPDVEVKIEGDVDLAERVLARMTVTP